MMNANTAAAADNDDTPIPPAQISADLEEHPDSSEEPLPKTQIAADLSDMDEAIKKTIKDANRISSKMEPPLSSSQLAALAEEMEEDDEEYNLTKRATPTTEADDDTSPPSLLAAPPIVEQEETLQQAQDPPTPAAAEADDDTSPPSLLAAPPIVEQEETLQQAQDPPSPAVARASSHPPTNQGQSPSSPRSQQQIPVRPPPPSMMPIPDEDADPPISDLPHDPSMPMVEATLVKDQLESPVYDAIQVTEQSRFEKNKKIIIGVGMGLLTGTAVTAGVLVSSNNGTSDSSGSLRLILKPSQSASPSDPPSRSLRPSISPSSLSLQPSQSTSPSDPPSRSLRPSISPSISASPTPFCFAGEINILSDSFPDDIRWSISRIDNVDGVANSTVVRTGFPEEKDYLTSEKVCLERGDYEFAICDSYGDGIRSPGNYNVTFDGAVIAQGGQFESEETITFSLPLRSLPPSESSSPNEFPSTSFQPSESIIPSQSLSPSPQPSNSFSPSTYWSSLGWNRQDTSFGGDTSGDLFGKAVAFSADASIMAVGAPGYLKDQERLGYVKVYYRMGEGSRWQQRGNTIHGEVYGASFGASLALSDDGMTLSIGAPFYHSASGQVKVYEWDEATLNYVQIGDTLYGAASTFDGDQFGGSLDISNSKILAVGARLSSANGNKSGQVTVYAWDGASTNFKQRGQAINGDAAEGRFGGSISLTENGQKLAVGAYKNDQVMVFEWDEATSSYKQLGDSLFGDAAGDWFGWSVSFSRDGTALAIGAPKNSENGQYSGQVKVFAWDEAALNFEQIGQSLFGKEPDYQFGISLALAEGRTLAVGTVKLSLSKPGYVEAYGWDEVSSEYKQLGQSFVSEASYECCGNALAFAGRGGVLAIGAPENDRNGTDSGRVELFEIEL